MPEPKIKIRIKYKENLERIKQMAKLAIGNSNVRESTHVY